MRLYLIGAGIAGLLALAGCGGGGIWQYGVERAAWRGEAEADCMKSGAITLNAGVVQMRSIDGPGMCGADYPLRVSLVGEGGTALGYGDEIRPPAAIPSASMPRWPVNDPPRHYGAPPRDLDAQARDLNRAAHGGQAPKNLPMNIVPSGIDNYMLRSAAPSPVYNPPRDLHPRDLHPQYVPPAYDPPRTVAPRHSPPPQQDDVADDIPDDAILPGRRLPARQSSAPPRHQSPKLGPARPMPVTQVKAAVSPPATLACPIVTALDKWVSESVQPAALRWFNQPVVEIKQISSYSCRGMVGGGNHISEHAFGNALDIAGFVLADGRKVMVKTGWHGRPEEAGFLHDVQGAACNVFTTVLAPGYNKYHYDHIHVDLMRRASGRTPCRPTPVPGEVAAAKQAKKSKYANRGDGLVTGSIGANVKVAIPGEDGFDEND